jgi:hypothetical protein
MCSGRFQTAPEPDVHYLVAKISLSATIFFHVPDIVEVHWMQQL